MFTRSGYTRRSIKIFSVAYAIAIALFYATYILYDVLQSTDPTTKAVAEAINYITTFYMDGVSFIMPILLGVTMMCVAEAAGKRHALMRAPLLTAPVAVYNLIYEYINRTMLGYDFIDALLLGVLWAIIAAVALYLHALIVFLVLRVLLRRSNDPAPCGAFDTSHPASRAILTVCLIKFAIVLGVEIYSAASYLIEYSGSYLTGEIIYMTVRFVFILSELLLCQLLAVKIRNALGLIFGAQNDTGEA